MKNNLHRVHIYKMCRFYCHIALHSVFNSRLFFFIYLILKNTPHSKKLLKILIGLIQTFKFPEKCNVWIILTKRYEIVKVKSVL